MDEELKKCPFCGGNPKIVETVDLEKYNSVTTYYKIVCRGCQLTTWDYYKDINELIKYWNKRI